MLLTLSYEDMRPKVYDYRECYSESFRNRQPIINQFPAFLIKYSWDLHIHSSDLRGADWSQHLQHKSHTVAYLSNQC